MQELVPIRDGRMLVSPFTFDRGAAAVMAADLAAHARFGHRRAGLRRCPHLELRRLRRPRPQARCSVPTTSTRPCPAHGSGTSSGWPPVRRSQAATSACPQISAAGSCADCVREYREGMRGFANESHLDVWYDRLTASELVERFGGQARRQGTDRVRHSRSPRRGARPVCGRSRSSPSASMASCAFATSRRSWFPCASCSSQATPVTRSAYVRELLDGVRGQPPTLTGATCSAPTASWTWHARSSASAASAPAPGCSCSSAATARMAQAKEAQPSVLEPYLGSSEFANHGERVVQGQRISHAASDTFLGWQRSPGPRRQEARFLRSPAVGLEGLGRPLHDERSGACTRTRARVAGPWRAPTPARVTGSRSRLIWRGPPSDRAIADFSAAYADQNELRLRSGWRMPSPQVKLLPRSGSEPGAVVEPPR